jgi:3-oxoacyl-[acyl-carrier protein] reductase
MGKTALVTGAGRGIGAATSLALAREGYHVVVTDILRAEGPATVAEIEEAGGSAEFCYLDVTDTTNVNDVIASVERERGAFDLLVNNAGFVNPTPLEDLNDAQWDKVLDANLKGMLRVCRAAAPAMKTARSGNIICLSSIAGHTVGWEGRLAYSASKAGIAGFVKSLAMELGPYDIRVNGIAPAGLHTTADQVPMRRVGTPADIANAVVLLASPQASFITGQIINVDGGFSVALFRGNTAVAK